MRKVPFPDLLVLAGVSVQAEQYVIATQFDTYQPATLKATLNGKATTLHHNADGSLDVTPFVKKGKNTLQLEWTPGKNGNTYAKSTLTLGAGTQGQWKRCTTG